MDVRVRFAPSPTGIPHVGNIRTAMFDYFFAKKNKGKFILRIEDTDQARKVEEAEEAIKESLTWLGAIWDEYIVQSARLLEYKKYAEELVNKNMAKVDDGAIRFIVPKGGATSWRDAVGDKKIEFQNSDIEDFIILKRDGFPTYHLANVIDDHDEKITHVIRGEDWIPSTPKHIMLYKAFGWEDSIPVFVHVPNIRESGGAKLSKRKGAKSVLDFKKEGYLPAALLNYLMLLGWSPKDDREILSKEEIEDDFDLKNINTAPATFDYKKLEWMNGIYIREKTGSEDLCKLLLDFAEDLNKIDPGVFDKLVEIAKSRGNTLAEIANLLKIILVKKEIRENDTLKERIVADLVELKDWDKQTLSDTIVQKYVMGEKINYKEIYRALLGIEKWLPLADTFEALGKDKTLELIR